MSWWGPWYGPTEAQVTGTVTVIPAVELLFTAGVAGALWGQAPDGSVVSYDQAPSSGIESYAMRVVTGAVKSGASSLSWGRIRGAGVRGKVLTNHLLKTRVLAEDQERELANKVVSLTTTTPANWPNTQAPEARTTSQRCSVFKVELTAYPATAEWTSIDVWLSGTSERAPSRNRS